MKTKKSFVTNSSSTSFIVSTDKDSSEKLEIKLESTLDFNDLYVETASNEEELWKLMENCGYEDNELYDKCLSEIKRGRKIHILWAHSDSDNVVEQLLCDHGLNEFLVNKDEINVILGDGGY